MPDIYNKLEGDPNVPTQLHVSVVPNDFEA